MKIKSKQAWTVLVSLAVGITALRKQNIGDPTTDYTIHGFKRRSLSTPAGRMNYKDFTSQRL